MNEEIMWAWTRFSFAATGGLLPMNFLAIEDDQMFLGFECDDNDPPIQCINGEVVRRVALSFPFNAKDFTWN